MVMDPAQVTTPTVFEIVKFVVEIVLIGGVGGVAGFLWKAINDWRNQLREERKLLLEERKVMLDEQKALQESLHQRWERLFSELKPAMESQAEVARKVADEFYRPVLDAIWRVHLYADVYETVDLCISAANDLIQTGKIPENVPPTVRDALRRHPDTKEFLKAMEEARPNGADYLCRQLDAFYQATEKLINSGYMSELEERAGLENLKRFFNCYYAADLPTLVKNRSPDDLSKFLKKWKTEELEPLRTLRDKVPWHEFLSHYYGTLRRALRATEV
jgi:hypothetical protein